MLKHGILGLLSYGSKTGWQVMQLFQKTLNYFWSAQTSQIYRELATLEKNGWATSSHEIGDAKRTYTITDSGRQELSRWLCEADFRLQVNKPLLMKVFFLAEVDKASALAFLKQAKADCMAKIDALSLVKEDITHDEAINKARQLFWQLTEDYGRRNLELTVDWLDKCIRILEEESCEHSVD